MITCVYSLTVHPTTEISEWLREVSSKIYIFDDEILDDGVAIDMNGTFEEYNGKTLRFSGFIEKKMNPDDNNSASISIEREFNLYVTELSDYTDSDVASDD
ncbi:hypothetical protein H4S08_002790, partial [Coemansia sp. RSA 1365]